MPKPTGRDIAISPTDAQDIPPGGAFFDFGPDSTKELLDSLNGDCAKLDDPKCSASLEQIFGNDDNNLVGRNLKQWFSLGKTLGRVRNVFLGAIAYLTIQWKANGGHLDEGQGLKLHFPPHALSVIQVRLRLPRSPTKRQITIQAPSQQLFRPQPRPAGTQKDYLALWPPMPMAITKAISRSPPPLMKRPTHSMNSSRKVNAQLRQRNVECKLRSVFPTMLNLMLIVW